MREKNRQIEKLRERLIRGEGPRGAKKQHNQGKLTSRERVDKLLDTGSFQEIGLWSEAWRTGFDTDNLDIPGDAVVTGSGEVKGRPVYVWAQDATTLDGTMAEVHIKKIVTVMERALRERVPIVGIYDSMGMRIQSAVQSHPHFSLGNMLRFMTISSGVIPQIALIMGPCTGGAALSATMADFTFMVKNTSYMHVIPQPEAVKEGEIGDAGVHSRISGCCDLLAESDDDCLQKCRQLLSLLPLNNTEKPLIITAEDNPAHIDEGIMDILPTEPSKPYDMRQVIRQVADNGYYFEVKKDYAPNITIGFSRLDRQTVGIVGSNPIFKGGCYDSNASDKHARFVRFCDAFNIPLVFLSDNPGFYPSVEEEQQGILRHGTMVIHANAEATVPKITIYVRKCYGGGHLAMPGNWLEVDREIAWPTVERGIMGAKEGVSIIWRKAIAQAKTPEEAERIRQENTKLLKKRIEINSRAWNDDIIDPRQTRAYLIVALKSLANKTRERPWRKHENMNL